jgi:anti-sigma factor RsiW
VRPHAWRRYAAAAAIFALGIGLGWLARGMFITPQLLPASLARLAASAHVVYSPEVRHPVEVTANEEVHLVGWLSKRLGTTLKAPKLAPLGYELVGGRLLSGPQGPVAHFMYQDGRGQRLTLYVSRQRGEPRDTAFRFSQEDRVSVFYWVDGNFGYALSGEIKREQLLDVAQVVYKQLNP